MVAHASRVPVIVCCEAYKFHERVQLDSICSNELGMYIYLLQMMRVLFTVYHWPFPVRRLMFL
jgi:translation initiation factor 2B subunit (eIF-2B alpha/beta/delta family)